MGRKKILAVAVASALAGYAGAASAGEGEGERVVVYGKLYPQVSVYDYKDATRAGTTGGSDLVGAPSATSDHAKRSTIDVSNSRIGFRGSEKLSNAFTAVYQIEQRVRFDDGTGMWAGNRDSFLGLASPAGTVKLGNMDTSYKQVGDKFSFLGISSGNFVANSNFLSRGPVDGLDFHLRQPNVIQYDSPKFFGFQALGSWGKDEGAGNPQRALNAILTSYGLSYEMGPIYAALGYENHKDFFQTGGFATAAPAAQRGTNVRSNDTATRLTVMGNFGGTTFSVDVSQLEWTETGVIPTGGFQTYKNRRIAAGVEQKFGAWTGAFSVVDSDEGSCTFNNASCSTAGFDGRLINFGVNYSFSRRTQAFLIVAQAKNGQSAAHNAVAINPSGNTAPQQGEDFMAIGAGVSHSF